MVVKLRDTWIVGIKHIKDGQARRIVSFVADSPEKALAMFAGTIFGRSEMYEITQVYKAASIYVEEKDNTGSHD